MALIRAFIAVELPEDLKKELAALEMLLKNNGPSVVKWVDPDSIHITLKFLGEISTDKVEKLIQAMDEAVKGTAPFQLKVRKLGAFPAPDRPQVIWVGVKGEVDKITRLQQSIEASCERLGFSRENRAFTPHLTLGRVRDEARPNERQRLGKQLMETSFTSLHNVEVTEINLLKSQLTPAGAIHTIIGTVKLA
jgi:RNA 2',3'-cyclic 3'-phosphodiesterase